MTASGVDSYVDPRPRIIELLTACRDELENGPGDLVPRVALSIVWEAKDRIDLALTLVRLAELALLALDAGSVCALPVDELLQTIALHLAMEPVR